MSKQICTGCDGVIGRDCFNPLECEEIARQKAERYDAQPFDALALLDQAQSERRKFVKAMQLAIDLTDPPSPAYQERFGKSTGYNNGWRVAEAMREVLVDCLGLERRFAEEPSCNCGASSDPGSCGHHPSCPMKKVEG